jgi:hypothetical protein
MMRASRRAVDRFTTNREHKKRGPPKRASSSIQSLIGYYFAAGADEAEDPFFDFLLLWCFLACVVEVFASEAGAAEAGASAASTGPANRIRARAGTSLLTTSRLH